MDQLWVIPNSYRGNGLAEVLSDETYRGLVPQGMRMREILESLTLADSRGCQAIDLSKPVLSDLVTSLYDSIKIPHANKHT